MGSRVVDRRGVAGRAISRVVARGTVGDGRLPEATAELEAEYDHGRFRDPGECSEIRTPEWATKATTEITPGARSGRDTEPGATTGSSSRWDPRLGRDVDAPITGTAVRRD
jgi:hypothetical protein